MSLESELFALIGPLAGGRVFPDTAPTDAARPYVVWQQIGGEALTYLDNTVPDRRNAYVQVVAWGDTRAAANALALQIEAELMQTTAMQARPQSALVADYEPDIARYGARQDFTIWALR